MAPVVAREVGVVVGALGVELGDHQGYGVLRRAERGQPVHVRLVARDPVGAVVVADVDVGLLAHAVDRHATVLHPGEELVHLVRLDRLESVAALVLVVVVAEQRAGVVVVRDVERVVDEGDVVRLGVAVEPNRALEPHAVVLRVDAVRGRVEPHAAVGHAVDVIPVLLNVIAAVVSRVAQVAKVTDGLVHHVVRPDVACVPLRRVLDVLAEDVNLALLCQSAFVVLVLQPRRNATREPHQRVEAELD
mmetsp:Transcript_33259/g.87949  ORF Transcript_33259/g.87949 Transcript_33259/m.87949 type:complete len:247 (-) Transcript_33259:682-1422(-)